LDFLELYVEFLKFLFIKLNIMKLFNKFFKKLNETDINYAVTGNTNDYPDFVESDIDIVINSNDLSKFWLFLKNLKKDNISWIQKITHEHSAHYCIIKFSTPSNHEILKPDICTDYIRNGKLFIKSKFLLENKKFNNKGFFELSPNREFLYYFLKKIDKALLNEKHFCHLKKNWDLSRNEINVDLKNYFSSESLKKINYFFDNNVILTKEDIIYFKQQLHKSLRYDFKNIYFHYSNKIKRVFKPTGLIVAFMGTDGCGKTTIIKSLDSKVIQAFRYSKIFHLYPLDLKQNQGAATNPQKEKNRSSFLSVLKLFYLFIIYLFGFLWNVFPLNLKSHLIVFDRYFHDHYVDKRRYRYGASNFWLNIFSKFIPKPDVWILLNGSTEVIQSRKQELSYKETERQLNSYLYLFKDLKNSFIIDSNQSKEKVQYNVEKIIFDVLELRMRKRVKN